MKEMAEPVHNCPAEDEQPKGENKANVVPTGMLYHWKQLVEGMSLSSQEFYTNAERLLGEHRLERTKVERVNLSEGGIFSSKREYLRVRLGEHVYHVPPRRSGMVSSSPGGSGLSSPASDYGRLTKCSDCGHSTRQYDLACHCACRHSGRRCDFALTRP